MAWTERYVRADAAGSGDGTTNTNSGATGAFTLAEAITHSTTNTGVRYNVAAAGGTFANTTTSRVFSGIGTTTAPNWWRGCSAVAGDLDADFTTAKPSITFTTGQFSITGAHQIFTNLNVSGATVSGNGVGVNSAASTPCWIDRSRFTNTAANSAGRAYTANGGITITRSYFQATSTSTIVMSVGSDAIIEGCTFTGGGAGINSIGLAVTIAYCTFRATGGHGIDCNGSTGRPFSVIGCTFRGTGGDGIKFTQVPLMCLLCNNLFAACVGTADNNGTGTNTNNVKRLGNDYYSNGAVEAGFGDSPSLSQLSESSDPHTSATNLSLVATASAKGAAQPGLFENESYTSYLDVGAVQRQEAGGVSGARIFGGF